MKRKREPFTDNSSWKRDALELFEDGFSLRFASEEMRKDRDIVLEAVQNNGLDLEFASDELKRDKSIVLEAVEQNGWAFKYAAGVLKTDRDIILKAATDNGWIYDHIPKEMLIDDSGILSAVIEDLVDDSYRLYNELDVSNAKEMNNTVERILEIMDKLDHILYTYGFWDIETSGDITSIVVECFMVLLDKALDFSKDHEHNFWKVMDQAVHCFRCISLNEVFYSPNTIYIGDATPPGSLKDDEETILKSVHQIGMLLYFASENLKNNKKIVLEAVKTYGHGLEWASEEL